jgi:hypothetical protein
VVSAARTSRAAGGHKKLAGSGAGPDGTAASLSFSHDHGAPGEGSTTALSAAAEHGGIGGGLGFKKSKDDTVVSASGQGAGIHAGIVASKSKGFEEFFGGWATELASVGGKFTREGMELKGEYTVWNTPISIPIPAAPALNMVITPSVKVSGEGEGYWGGQNKGNIDITAAVTGGVSLGMSVGAANFAEAYIQAGPTVTGAFRYTRTAHAEGDTAAAPTAPAPAAATTASTPAAVAPPASTATKAPWKLGGSINVKVNANVGVNVLGGLINPTYDLASADLFTVSGLDFDHTGFHNNLQFVWGEKFQRAFNFLQGEWIPAEGLVTKTKTKLSAAKEKARASASRGKRKFKVLFSSEEQVLAKAKQESGNSAAVVDKRLDTMELTGPEA